MGLLCCPGLKLLGSSRPPTLASQEAGAMGVQCCTCLSCHFYYSLPLALLFCIKHDFFEKNLWKPLTCSLTRVCEMHCSLVGHLGVTWGSPGDRTATQVRAASSKVAARPSALWPALPRDTPACVAIDRRRT